GFLSSLTGTGGPLLLMPILLTMRLGVLASVGLSQIFQLPVALAATAGNIVYGKLDLALGMILAASLSSGSWFGAKLAHAVPRAALRVTASSALVVIGLFILVNVLAPDRITGLRGPSPFSISRGSAAGQPARHWLTLCGQALSRSAAAPD